MICKARESNKPGGSPQGKEQSRGCSRGKEQTRGCPQGSSFAPLVWNLFQNHLPLYVESENFFMYGDDHRIYMTGDSIKKMFKK